MNKENKKKMLVIKKGVKVLAMAITTAFYFILMMVFYNAYNSPTKNFIIDVNGLGESGIEFYFFTFIITPFVLFGLILMIKDFFKTKLNQEIKLK